MLDTPMLYSVHVALAAERWRRDHGKVIREWVDGARRVRGAVVPGGLQLRAPAGSLSRDRCRGGDVCGIELGHPLIPAAKCVRNSVSIEEPTRMLLVSGSNMSGKSTLLRTVGINTVLAMAGAPGTRPEPAADAVAGGRQHPSERLAARG